MIQDHKAYPNITRLTLDMVAYNGGLHRLRATHIGAVQDVKNKLDECLGADGIYHDDLKKLDDWLGSLSEDQFMTVADGEESEMQALLNQAPNIGDPEDSASDFFNHLYEHCI
ncbi:MAG: hypothetical protein Unbinned4120contig1000_44 [Prokaryotic dsDNA virus sp.]|jgi:hypothetical protein|nr:MAG: hypothetical protein Unbinned4120contig1000_44 [Prokaryotic dsDNA virus sp.]|tara:strand:- start:28401 stop:28739 length:339 start_codon:yes stop_codon:yes gene_type:complete